MRSSEVWSKEKAGDTPALCLFYPPVTGQEECEIGFEARVMGEGR